MPYILTKFFAKEEYQQAFVKGNFYLSKKNKIVSNNIQYIIFGK